jgi:polyisoprenoid-binding protein YceI
MRRNKLAVATLLAGLAGTAVAASEKYTIEPMHTFPSVEFSHMNISTWRGKFDRTAGTVVIDTAARTGKVDIVVDAASINFGLKEMDEKARSEDFFNVAQYPKVTYKGALKFTGDVPTTIEGEITLLAVTKPLKLTINSFTCIDHPFYKKKVCGADVEGDLNWSEYGMKWSQYGAGDAGKVKLRVQVEAIKD